MIDRMRSAICAVTAAVCILAARKAEAGPAATFVPLGDLPGGDFYSYAFDVSDDGAIVVGWSKANDQVSGQYRAYRWTEARGMVALGHIGPTNANGIARAISRDGSVIIGSCGVEFRWTEATGMVELPGACAAQDLSADGSVIVGQCFNAPGTQAATWTAETDWVLHGALGVDPVDAYFSGVSADGSVACGQSMIEGFAVEPTRWTQRTGMIGLGDVPGGIHYALAWAISADGSTIVGDAIGDVGADAFRWDAATGPVNLEMAEPGVADSIAKDCSADGSILVGYADNGINAMIWDQVHGMRGIQQVLLDEHGLDLPGWTLLGAQAISGDGRTIVGHGWNPSGDLEGWRVMLPAPGDVNGDGTVGIADLLVLLGAWGPCLDCGDCPADLDGDCLVGVVDLLTLLANWT